MCSAHASMSMASSAPGTVPAISTSSAEWCKASCSVHSGADSLAQESMCSRRGAQSRFSTCAKEQSWVSGVERTSLVGRLSKPAVRASRTDFDPGDAKPAFTNCGQMTSRTKVYVTMFSQDLPSPAAVIQAPQSSVRESFIEAGATRSDQGAKQERPGLELEVRGWCGI